MVSGKYRDSVGIVVFGYGGQMLIYRTLPRIFLTTVTVQTVTTHYFNHRNRAAQMWLYQGVTAVLTYRGIMYGRNSRLPL